MIWLCAAPHHVVSLAVSRVSSCCVCTKILHRTCGYGRTASSELKVRSCAGRITSWECIYVYQLMMHICVRMHIEILNIYEHKYPRQIDNQSSHKVTPVMYSYFQVQLMYPLLQNVYGNISRNVSLDTSSVDSWINPNALEVAFISMLWPSGCSTGVPNFTIKSFEWDANSLETFVGSHYNSNSTLSPPLTSKVTALSNIIQVPQFSATIIAKVQDCRRAL